MLAEILADRFVFVLADAAVKAALLLTFAAVLVLCLRRASASFRHLVWALGLGGALFLPLLSCNLPHWRVFVAAVPTPVQSAPTLAPPAVQAAPKRASAPQAPSAQVVPASETAPGAFAPPLSTPAPLPASAAMPARAMPQMSWPLLVVFVWLAGALVALAQLARGLAALREVSRGSVVVAAGPLAEAALAAALSLLVTQKVEIRQAATGGQVTVPLTYGIHRPVIVLPAGADLWPTPRLTAALLHETAHVKRRDWALQVLGQIAGALYWFHPLVWLAQSQMRAESEAACDDLVLAAGVPAPDYARHLLDVALSVRDLRHLRSSAVAMAQGPKVEGRLRAVLASGLSRRPVARQAAAAVLTAGLLLLVPLAALRLVAQVKQIPVPAAAALQLHGDFTLRYAVTITDRTPVATQLREYQQLRSQYDALLKQDPNFQPVPAEYDAPFSYFRERHPKIRHVVLTVSSQDGKLLWRSEEGGSTFAVVYDGKSGTQLFSNGHTGRIEPGFKFSYMNNCPLPAVGLPDVPLLKGATLLSTLGSQQTWQGQCPSVSIDEQGKIFYTDAIAHVTQDGGEWKMLDVDSLGQRLAFLQHQKFEGLWIASHMTLTRYADDTEGNFPSSSLADLITYYDAHRTPTSVCEYHLLSASATPLDLSAAGMHQVSAAPQGPIDPSAAQAQALDSFDVQEALHLRFHLQPWADSHRNLLQQMAAGQPGAAARVAGSLSALPFPLWFGDPRPNHVWDGDPRVGHAGQPPQLMPLRFAGPVSASRDFAVARTPRFVRLPAADAHPYIPLVVLWASGRITMTTPTPFIGRRYSIIEQDVTPPFLADGAAASAPPSVTPAQAQSAASLVALGQKLQQQGQPRDGIPEFRQAVQLDPNNADAQFWLADALYTIKDKRVGNTTFSYAAPLLVLDEAILHMQKAVALRPKDPSWHSTLGTYLANRGRHLEAIAEYRRSMHLMPPLSPADISPSADGSISGNAIPWYDAYWLLGEELIKTGQYQMAVVNLRQALRFRPSDGPNLLWLGDALNGEGRRSEARATWKKSLAAKPPNPYYQRLARQRLAQYPY